jgi:hypothetical protein
MYTIAYVLDENSANQVTLASVLCGKKPHKIILIL